MRKVIFLRTSMGWLVLSGKVISQLDDNNRNFIGEVLSEAPLAIATLCSLIVKGNQAFDTNIDHHVPEGGFKFIKWPKSFVSSLVQVGHEGPRLPSFKPTQI